MPAPRLATQAVAFGAPIGLSVALPRSRARDVAVCALQMWAYLAAYKTPHDDEDAQRRRVHLRYPIVKLLLCHMCTFRQFEAGKLETIFD